MIKIRRTENLKLVKELHEKCFPADRFYSHKKNRYWIIMDGRRAIGFTIATEWDSSLLFFSRSGIINSYRGKGLHKRLISVRLRYARSNGFTQAITYTLPTNPASSNNLIRRGFVTYTPAYSWVGDEVNYWIKDIK